MSAIRLVLLLAATLAIPVAAFLIGGRCTVSIAGTDAASYALVVDRLTGEVRECDRIGCEPYPKIPGSFPP